MQFVCCVHVLLVDEKLHQWVPPFQHACLLTPYITREWDVSPFLPYLLVKQFEASYAPLHKRKLATIQNDDVSPNKIDTN